jgi:hypothetical protein
MAIAVILGVFKPVEYRWRYLVASGLAKDIPVNIAKIFDADIIIAVFAATNITKTMSIMCSRFLYRQYIHIFREESWIRII